MKDREPWCAAVCGGHKESDTTCNGTKTNVNLKNGSNRVGKMVKFIKHFIVFKALSHIVCTPSKALWDCKER